MHCSPKKGLRPTAGGGVAEVDCWLIRCAATTHALARARLSDFFEQIITFTS
jgi:hypothetical protein